MRQPITVLVCDASEIIRKGIEIIVTHSGLGSVVSSCGTGQQAIAEASRAKPKIVVTDLEVPDMDGVQLIRSLKEQPDRPQVVVLAKNSNENSVIAAIAAGADSYCLKEAKRTHLEDAIIAASTGACWLHPEIGASFLRRSVPRNSFEAGSHANAANPVAGSNKLRRLSPREVEILQLIAQGLSNREIGEKLFVSAETVKTHIRHIMEKLEVADRTQAVIKAIREGLLETA